MSDWISVREKMPPDTTSVLVWCPGQRNKYTACWISPNWIHFGGAFGKQIEEDVTHWMPTPEPPPPPSKETVILSVLQEWGRFSTYDFPSVARDIAAALESE